VEKLRKWAPVRTYHGNMENGERGERWRMMLRLLTRHGIEDDQDTFKPQPFSLIVTISDPQKKVRVYDEMALLVRNRFQSQNLTVRSATRVQARA
jgi:serine protease AprX